jgi:single-strand DNA-binding protein
MSLFSINRVVLVGRLTREPELRSLPSGVGACRLRVACNSSRKDADGEYREYPNFFDVNVYGGSADSVARYMHKGSRIAVDGRLEWREWEGPAQERRQAVSIVAETVQFLDSRGGLEREGEGDGFDDPGTEQDGELAGVASGQGPDDELVF